MPIGATLAATAATVGGSAYAANQASKGQKASAAAGQAATDYATAEQRRQYDLSRADNAPWLQTGQGALGQLARLYGINQGPQGGALTQAYPQQQVQQSYGGNVTTPGGSFSVPSYDGRQGGTYANMMAMVESGQLQGDPVGGMGTAEYGQGQQVPMNLGAQTTQAPAQGGGQFDSFWQSPDYNVAMNEGMRAQVARNSALGIQQSGAADKSAMRFASGLGAQQYNSYVNRLAALAGVGQTAAGQNQQLGQNFAGAVGNLAMNNASNLSSSYQNQAAINGQFGQQIAGIGSGLLMNNAKAIGGWFGR